MTFHIVIPHAHHVRDVFAFIKTCHPDRTTMHIAIAIFTQLRVKFPYAHDALAAALK